ncbi:unnamed protein product [Darwinula stevensoni]|uniref:Phorbol-ester/DAG-type domain-containing protein n=1 Tax=Darwinula stevensoni TaxID=69355 RepID=A0A7R8XH37_9CRUS|nr:unnamed protein product [Darwinula stevensoni]CAG0890060.1 unnamed protein product [Darwinula stevensoni]
MFPWSLVCYALRQEALTSSVLRSYGRFLHKRSTIEILIRGKMASGGQDNQQMYSQPHRFEKYNYTAPTHCDHCNHLLWGIVKTGTRCMDCGLNCHEKCMDAVTKNCPKYKAVIDAAVIGSSAILAPSEDGSSIASTKKSQGYLCLLVVFSSSSELAPES